MTSNVDRSVVVPGTRDTDPKVANRCRTANANTGSVWAPEFSSTESAGAAGNVPWKNRIAQSPLKSNSLLIVMGCFDTLFLTFFKHVGLKRTGSFRKLTLCLTSFVSFGHVPL